MLMEELQTIEAPTDAEFWAGVAIGVGAGLLIGALLC
jgi:hypothetical protein